jgi:hypothetical protein
MPLPSLKVEMAQITWAAAVAAQVHHLQIVFPFTPKVVLAVLESLYCNIKLGQLLPVLHHLKQTVTLHLAEHY